ncbi:Xylosyltransferase, family GT14 [Ectocarpus siliculosus]|uniref:protein xylosyltransferase n=1 Tax=Ectocarpus siliculosus TaxID=2880 RepID=D8LMY0_ECTSI|nr:Xylosyltransferase, family GT14 [Ectocarpus siliculosus]|eukprot:CBN74781.1 Xylosyltransferase, family GT14 [Ectocarpus siliculosus]
MGVWRASCVWLLLSLCLPSLLVLAQDGQQAAEPAGKAAAEGQKKKPFENMKNKPARDYDGVDPSFEATLEGSMTAGQAQIDAETKIAAHTHARLESLLRGARTEECREEIVTAYQRYMGAQALERSLPFEGEKFSPQCADPNKRPDMPETGLIDPEEVRLVYVILAHDEPAQIVRLVDALDDTPGRDRTWFVIHIDAKADDVQQEIKKVFIDRPNVIIMEEDRLDVAWGGFNVVQASLNAVSLALEREIPFHWLWILSGTTYPIVSNDAIRGKLSSHHPESIFMEVKPSVHKPASTTWHYFVECDSALHRIGRNLIPRGLDMYVGSQWLAMPPSVARWLMEDTGLVPKYREYAKHIVVADENFLPTVIKNSPFCGNLVSSNLVHVQFDKYEHTLDREDRRADKCLMPNPDHCGRSPATMTVDYLSVLEHSSMLFARKFNPKDSQVFDVLDMVRDGGQAWREGPTFDYISIRSPIIHSSSGGAAEHLCLSVGPPPPKKPGSPPNTEAVMVKCSGADPRQIFKLGPCIGSPV